MRCPKCGFITFDHVASCAKCKTDLQNVSGGFQGTSANVKPPSLLGSVTKQAPEPSVDDLLEGQDVGFGDEPTNEASLNLDDDFGASDDLSDIDLNELPTIDSEDVDDDAIPSLEPLSAVDGFDDEPLPQLEKISSELSDIDISDLVANDDDEAIPSLEPLSENPVEELATLEPLADDDTEIPEITALSSSDSFDDLDLSADDELSSLLDNSDLDDFDHDDDTIEASAPDVQPFEQPVVTEEPIDDLLATPLEPLSVPEETAPGLSLSDDGDSTLNDDQTDTLDSLEEGYDLSFEGANDEPSPISAGEGDTIDLSLELEEGMGGQPLKTPPPPVSPDIPDLGLTLESDQE